MTSLHRPLPVGAMWREFLSGLQDPPAPARVDAAREALKQSYAEPPRAYHTLLHAADMALQLRSAPLPIADRHRLEWAAWYHDAVYESRRSDNEEQSADLAAGWMAKLDRPAEEAAHVERLILVTRSHEASRPDEKAMCDADLRILARTPEEYDLYAAAIRHEYGWVPEQRYAEGRAAVLERLLSRERLFQGVLAGDQEEEAARANLCRELMSLDRTR